MLRQRSTVVDPTDPSVFWTFQEFVFDTDVWGVSITKLVVPEPGTGALVALGGALGGALSRRGRGLRQVPEDEKHARGRACR